MLRSPRYEGSDKVASSPSDIPFQVEDSSQETAPSSLPLKSTSSQVKTSSSQLKVQRFFKRPQKTPSKTLFNVSGTTELQSLRPGKPVHFSFRIPTLQRSYETESSRRLCLEARNLLHSPKLASLWPFTRPRPFKKTNFLPISGSPLLAATSHFRCNEATICAFSVSVAEEDWRDSSKARTLAAYSSSLSLSGPVDPIAAVGVVGAAVGEATPL